MEKRVRGNVGNLDYKEHVASIENLPDGPDFRAEEVYMWQALAQIWVCVCVIECVSLGHYGQMFGKLSYGLLISKRSWDEMQSLCFPYFFKVVTTNGNITA